MCLSFLDQISLLLPLWNVIVEKWFKGKESSAKAFLPVEELGNSAVGPREQKRTVEVVWLVL